MPARTNPNSDDTQPAPAVSSTAPQEQGASPEQPAPPAEASAPQPIYVTSGPQPLSPEQAAQAALQAAQIQQEQNSTVPGGRYKVGEQYVNANGEPVK